MSARPQISNYVAIGTAVAMIATSVVASPFRLSTEHARSPQAVIDAGFAQLPATVYVNRTRKGDRLPGAAGEPETIPTVQAWKIAAPIRPALRSAPSIRRDI